MRLNAVGARLLFIKVICLFSVIEERLSHAITLEFEPVASGLVDPTFVTHAGDGSGRLFVLEQRGRIRIIKDGAILETDFLDMGPTGMNVIPQGLAEQGILGMVFHPEFADNGFFYVSYSRRSDSRSVISRFKVSTNPDVADTTETILLGPIMQPQSTHKAGMIAWGPDGYLYYSLGDGGGFGDIGNGHHPDVGNGQATDTLLGKILRIDVHNPSPFRKYGIPSDNPFADGANGAMPEIYAFGFRNPWRFSIDPLNGNLYCGDVGQGSYEEIDLVVKGGNYGWRRMEGRHCFNPTTECQTDDLILPVLEYHHSEGCSVTGGYVYRGSRFPAMGGRYFFGDYCRGTVWMLGTDGSKTVVGTLPMHLSSFGVDEEGELYACGYPNPAGQPMGVIYKIVDTGPQPPTGRAAADFNLDGCTDLIDCFFFMDHWGLDHEGTPIGLTDFLALTDNWKMGPDC